MEKQKTMIERAVSESENFSPNSVARKAIQLVGVELRKRNPYPEDVFIPLKKEEFEDIKKIFKKHKVGVTFDRISAYIMRISWNNACDELKKIEEEEVTH